MSLVAPEAPSDPCVVIEVADAPAASGGLAGRLAAAFAEARDAGLGENGCVVFHAHGGEALRAGLSGLARSLALEWGSRGIRVNVVVGEDADDLIRFLASPASRMLTGAVLDA